MCYGTPNFAKVRALLAPLTACLETQDSQILSDALWAISGIMQDKVSRTEVSRQTNVKKILELVSYPSPDISMPAMRIIGLMCAGDHQSTSLVIVNEGTKIICATLKNVDLNKAISKEAYWALSNIVLDTNSEILILVKFGIIKEIGSILESSSIYSVIP